MNSFAAVVPLLVIVGAALLIFLLEAFLKKENKNYLGYLALFSLLGCAVLAASAWNAGLSYFDGMLRWDKLALFLTFLLLVAVAFVVLIGMKYIAQQDANHGEFYGLLLLALSGLMIMVSSTHMIAIFLGLEVLSVSSYALAGLKRKDDRSSEAAVKYFLMGSFASAFLVFGLAVLFGSARTLDIPALAAFFRTGPDNQILGLIGLGLVLVGFAFKIAFVPFHMWAPDVYEGAPIPVTAFFSIGPKAAGLTVLIRLLAPVWNSGFRSEKVFDFLWAVAALTMLVGSLTALRQKNIKRMFAYSSIANAGYMLIAVLAGDGTGLLFFLTAYTFMSIGAFGSLIALSRKGCEYNEFEDFSGVGFKYPWIGALFSVFLLSLAGFPPTGGFLAKFYVFLAAVQKGLIPLVLIAVLSSLISVYYYLRIIVHMYMRDPERDISIEIENPALYLVLFLCLYGILQLGLFPGNVLYLIRQAFAGLL